ncbi:MAG: hypothetical protein LBF22_14610 [Deltaproteobacteria bacterium]|nr:hypothetical protein [Deltaproteobacteria bacterium]
MSVLQKLNELSVLKLKRAKILGLGILALVFLVARPAHSVPYVLDLQELQALGLQDTTIQEIVTASLSPRGRPPIEGSFLKEMAQYGGDSLTRAYVELDKTTAALRDPVFSEKTVSQMIQNKVPSEAIVSEINETLARYKTGQRPQRRTLENANQENGNQENDNQAHFGKGEIIFASGIGLAGAGGIIAASQSENGFNGPGNLSSQNITSPVSETSTLNETLNETPTQTYTQLGIQEEDLLDSSVPLTSEDYPGENFMGGPKNHASGIVPESEVPLELGRAGSLLASGVPPQHQPLESLPKVTTPSREELRKTPQTLHRGEQADPARPLALPERNYPVREPGPEHAFFMGSFEQTTLDDHEVVIHRNSRSGYVGNRVEETPSGHKVYRYFSGKPEVTQEEIDAKEKRNSLGGTPRDRADLR